MGEWKTRNEIVTERLFNAGQRRAAERAARVRGLRVDRTHPLVLAVFERWSVEPLDASDEVASLAVSAVQAVVNCLDLEDAE